MADRGRPNDPESGSCGKSREGGETGGSSAIGKPAADAVHSVQPGAGRRRNPGCPGAAGNPPWWPGERLVREKPATVRRRSRPPRRFIPLGRVGSPAKSRLSGPNRKSEHGGGHTREKRRRGRERRCPGGEASRQCGLSRPTARGPLEKSRLPKRGRKSERGGGTQARKAAEKVRAAAGWKSWPPMLSPPPRPPVPRGRAGRAVRLSRRGRVPPARPPRAGCRPCRAAPGSGAAARSARPGRGIPRAT